MKSGHGEGVAPELEIDRPRWKHCDAQPGLNHLEDEIRHREDDDPRGTGIATEE